MKKRYTTRQTFGGVGSVVAVFLDFAFPLKRPLWIIFAKSSIYFLGYVSWLTPVPGGGRVYDCGYVVKKHPHPCPPNRISHSMGFYDLLHTFTPTPCLQHFDAGRKSKTLKSGLKARTFCKCSFPLNKIET